MEKRTKKRASSSVRNKTKIHYFFSLLFLTGVFCSLTACLNIFRERNCDLKDKAAEEARAREMLRDTSPRNMNQLPKATPEFRTNLPGRLYNPEPDVICEE